MAANRQMLTAARTYFREYANGDLKAEAGSLILNFPYDSGIVALHSQADTWQRAFGYNDVYDQVFDYVTIMRRNKINFTHDGKEHILWSWKGDYWNLQYGAENGLYVYNRTVNGEEHYDAVDYELPMTLSLYNIYNGYPINVFSWAPDELQWWITGFNPSYKTPDPDSMKLVCSVDFSDKQDIYDSLKKADFSEQNAEVIFDNEYHTVWIVF